MKSKVKIDIHHDNQPIVKITCPEPVKGEDEDVRDKLVNKFLYPAYYTREHSAFDGIAGENIIRRGYPCILEHWHGDEYVIRPVGLNVTDLEILKEYIDTLIRFERARCGDDGNYANAEESTPPDRKSRKRIIKNRI